MIKVVALIKRRSGLSLEEFSRRYFEQHMALCHATVPAHVARVIKRNVQNHARVLGGGEPPYDCVTEIEFEDEAGLRTWTDWYLGPEGQVLREDEEHFMDTSARVIVVTDERVPRQYV